MCVLEVADVPSVCLPQAARNGEEGQGEREAAPSTQLLLGLHAPGGQHGGADVAQVAWAEAGGAFLLAAAAGGTLAVFSLQRCAPVTSGGWLRAAARSCDTTVQASPRVALQSAGMYCAALCFDFFPQVVEALACSSICVSLVPLLCCGTSLPGPCSQ